MGEGLAQTMAYGSGEGNTIKHYYAGSMSNQSKKKGKKMACKKKKPTKK